MHQNNLLILEVKTVSKGFVLVNQFVSLSGVELYEGSYWGERGFLILLKFESSQKKQIEDVLEKSKQDINCFGVIENLSEGLLEKIYALAAEKVDGAMAFVECAKGVNCLGLSHMALLQNLLLIEVKLFRSSGSGGLVILSGPLKALLQFKNLEDVKRACTHFEIIEHPQEVFLDHYF